MAIQQANIESLEESIISYSVQFNKDRIAAHSFNIKYPGITQMIWITKQTCMDDGYTVYNPKALILVVLN